MFVLVVALVNHLLRLCVLTCDIKKHRTGGQVFHVLAVVVLCTGSSRRIMVVLRYAREKALSARAVVHHQHIPLNTVLVQY